MAAFFCLGKSIFFVFILFLMGHGLIAQEYGLQLYSLRNQFAKDAPGTMAKVKAMGFKDVEMA
jgi:hypothetical protein